LRWGIKNKSPRHTPVCDQLREYSVVGQFEISAYNPCDHWADQTYQKYDNA